MFHWKKLAALLCAGICFAGTAAEYQIPFMEKAPVIDGKFSADEWKSSAAYTGVYHRGKEMFLSGRHAVWNIGYDNKNLYVSMRTELPPAGTKLISTTRRRDGKTLLYDDNIEFWIADSEKTADRSYYFVMVNTKGTVSDTKFYISGKMAEPKWENAWTIKNGLDQQNKVWVAEYAIPLNSLKFNGNLTGQKLSMMLCRNWQRPFTQTPFLQFPHAFTGVQFYPVFRFAEKDFLPVKVESIKGLPNRDFTLDGSVFNPGKITRKLTAEMVWTHSDMPTHKETKTLTAAPGKSVPFRFHTSTNYIHNMAKHTAVITVKDEKGAVIYSDKYAWKLPMNLADVWKVSTPETAAQISFYPSTNVLGFRLQVYGGTDQVKVQIVKKGGKEIAVRNFPVSKGEVIRYFQLPVIGEGTYQVNFSLITNGKTEKTLSNEFTRKIFPWENNNLGITDQVFPPFKDLKYGKDSIQTVTNKIKFGDTGLYSSVIADGKELLSKPVTLNYRDSSGKSGLKVLSKGFVSEKKNTGKWKSVMKGNGFTLENLVETDYDGCSKFTFTFVPEKGKTPVIQQMYLDIPLKSDLIRLFHIVSAGVIRNNPAIKVPAGNGVVWSSTEHANGDMYGNMHCYLWLGEMARGLCWFSDSEKEMSLNEKKVAQELIRKGGELTLRIWFANQDMKLDGKRTIVFGMQPSPTKPMPKDWRKPKYEIPPHGGSAWYGGCATGMGKYPTQNDWEVIDRMKLARETGKLDRAYVESWLNKYWKGHPLYNHVRNHIYGGFVNFMINRPKSPTMIYFEEYGIDQFSPEFRVFQDEWGSYEFTQRKWMDWKDITTTSAAANSVKIIPVKSYQDYALWYGREWMKRGVGLYFDNVYPKNIFNRHNSLAYTRKDGQTQPCSAIWTMREYHKRMWVMSRMLQKETKWPLQISLHTTNCMCIPILTWTDTMLDLEWGWANGTRPFPQELLEIESTARQIGAYPHAHFPLVGNAVTHPHDATYMSGKAVPEMVKTDWAMRMIYEILRQQYRGMDFRPYDKMVYDFGYPNCKIMNYWDDNYPVKVDNDAVKSILLNNGKKIMIIFASWSEKPVTVNVKLDSSLKVKNPSFQLKFNKFGAEIIEKEIIK